MNSNAYQRLRITRSDIFEDVLIRWVLDWNGRDPTICDLRVPLIGMDGIDDHRQAFKVMLRHSGLNELADSLQ